MITEVKHHLAQVYSDWGCRVFISFYAAFTFELIIITIIILYIIHIVLSMCSIFL